MSRIDEIRERLIAAEINHGKDGIYCRDLNFLLAEVARLEAKVKQSYDATEKVFKLNHRISELTEALELISINGKCNCKPGEVSLDSQAVARKALGKGEK